eukprot:TRINITY_DN10575_c3_g1_i1.p1 TRINITY_DN10575_c3_g1~~TRINITY_DN10575_c3_g1_i1.p1  ORF type:complete len:698 (-),score=150.59 TRINITY_DN10575_c3_g1_i1:130-2223(-)
MDSDPGGCEHGSGPPSRPRRQTSIFQQRFQEGRGHSRPHRMSVRSESPAAAAAAAAAAASDHHPTHKKRGHRQATLFGPDAALGWKPDRTHYRRASLTTEEAIYRQMEEKMKSCKAKDDSEDDDDCDETQLHPAVRTIRTITRSRPYQLALAFLTLVSVTSLAHEADIRASGEEITDAHWVLEAMLLGIYSLDLVLRLGVYKVRTFFRSYWNRLDFVLVVTDIIIELLGTIPGAVTAVKVVRFLRLGRLVRSCTELRELYLMCVGMIASIRAMLFGTMLTLLLLVMFSILAVYLVRPVAHRLEEKGVFGDCANCGEAFDTVGSATLTLLTTVIAGDSWGKVSLPLIHHDSMAAMIIFAAFFTIELGLLNTIAAVIVDKQVAARAQDEEFMMLLQSEELAGSFEEVGMMFGALDEDASDSLSLEELKSYYDNNDEFRTFLNRMDIHKDQLPVVFDIIDRDRSGCVDFLEFVAGLHNLKHEDAHTLAMFARHYGERVHEHLADIVQIKDQVDQQHLMLQRLVHSVTENSAPHKEFLHDAENILQALTELLEEDKEKRRTGSTRSSIVDSKAALLRSRDSLAVRKSRCRKAVENGARKDDDSDADSDEAMEVVIVHDVLQNGDRACLNGNADVGDKPLKSCLKSNGAAGASGLRDGAAARESAITCVPLETPTLRRTTVGQPTEQPPLEKQEAADHTGKI